MKYIYNTTDGQVLKKRKHGITAAVFLPFLLIAVILVSLITSIVPAYTAKPDIAPHDAIEVNLVGGGKIYVKITETVTRIQQGKSFLFNMDYWVDTDVHIHEDATMTITIPAGFFDGEFAGVYRSANYHIKDHTIAGSGTGVKTLKFTFGTIRPDFAIGNATQGSVSFQYAVTTTATPGILDPSMTSGGVSVYSKGLEVTTITPNPAGQYHSVQKNISYASKTQAPEVSWRSDADVYGVRKTTSYLYGKSDADLVCYTINMNSGSGAKWLEDSVTFNEIELVETLPEGLELYTPAEIADLKTWMRNTSSVSEGGLSYPNQATLMRDDYSLVMRFVTHKPNGDSDVYYNLPANTANDYAASGLDISYDPATRELRVKIKPDPDAQKLRGTVGSVSAYMQKNDTPIIQLLLKKLPTTEGFQMYDNNVKANYVMSNNAVMQYEYDNRLIFTGGASSQFVNKKVGMTPETVTLHGVDNPLVIDPEMIKPNNTVDVYYTVEYLVTGDPAAPYPEPDSIDLLDELPAAFIAAEWVPEYTSSQINKGDGTITGTPGNIDVVIRNNQQVNLGSGGVPTLVTATFKATLDMTAEQAGVEIHNVIKKNGNPVTPPSVIRMPTEVYFTKTLGYGLDYPNTVADAGLVVTFEVLKYYSSIDDYGPITVDYENYKYRYVLNKDNDWLGKIWLVPGQYKIVETEYDTEKYVVPPEVLFTVNADGEIINNSTSGLTSFSYYEKWDGSGITKQQGGFCLSNRLKAGSIQITKIVADTNDNGVFTYTVKKNGSPVNLTQNSIKVTKTSETGTLNTNPADLAAGKFTMTRDTVVKVENLSPGDYCVVEDAPGYNITVQMNAEPPDSLVTDQAQAYCTVTADTTQRVSFTNVKYALLKIQKLVTGTDGLTIPFTFTLKDINGDHVPLNSNGVSIVKVGETGTYGSSGTSLASGKFTLTHDTTVLIKGLVPGQYTIVEDSTPGYAASYTLNGGSSIHSASAQTGNIAAGSTANIVYTNASGLILPDAGGIGTGLFNIIGMMLTLSLCGFFVCRRMRKRLF